MPATVKLSITRAEALAQGYIETTTAAKMVNLDHRSACKYMKNIGLRSYAPKNSLSFVWELAEVTKLANERKAMSAKQTSLLLNDKKPEVVVTPTEPTASKTQKSGSEKLQLIGLKEFRKISMTPSITPWKLKKIGIDSAATFGETGATPLYRVSDAVKYRDTYSRNGRKALARLVSTNPKVKSAMESQIESGIKSLPSLTALQKQYPSIGSDLTKLFESLLASAQSKKS